MKSIVLITFFYGDKLPKYFPVFINSAKLNPTINWVILTDHSINNLPDNIKLIRHTKDEMLQNYMEKFNINADRDYPINIEPEMDSVSKQRKPHSVPFMVSNLRPAYAFLYESIIRNYDFWGYCDLDVVWGDVRKFLTSDILKTFEAVSAKKNELGFYMSGFFTICKNSMLVNRAFNSIERIRNLMAYKRSDNLEEYDFAKVIEKNFRYCHIEQCASYTRMLNNSKNTKNWLWNNGKLFDPTGNEYMCLHMRAWKSKFKTYNILDKCFYISQSGFTKDKI